MLKKFPAFKDEIDLDTDDDIRKKMFDEFHLGEHCEGLDYADDIEPWLGDRAAIARWTPAASSPTPVFVVQVKDADAAEDGLSKIAQCDGESGENAAAGRSRATGPCSPRPTRSPRASPRTPPSRRSPTTRTTRSGPTRSVTPAW